MIRMCMVLIVMQTIIDDISMTMKTMMIRGRRMPKMASKRNDLNDGADNVIEFQKGRQRESDWKKETPGAIR
eukprot:768235-Hanusia_phi.AAC.4